jgi:hypothetical protein
MEWQEKCKEKVVTAEGRFITVIPSTAQHRTVSRISAVLPAGTLASVSATEVDCGYILWNWRS